MSGTFLVAASDLRDRAPTRSALTLAAFAADQGRKVAVLTAEDGALGVQARAIGEVVDISSVNELRVARLVGRVGLAPVGRLLKSRRVRSMLGALGAVDQVLVATPQAFDLVGWLPAGERRVAAVVPQGGVTADDAARLRTAAPHVVLAHPDDEVDALAAATLVEAGLVVAPPTIDDDNRLVAVAGLAGDDLESFVVAARAVRRLFPQATVGWVRDDDGDDDRWAWPLFGRGDLVDLAGVVTAVDPSGSTPVRAVVSAGTRHPLVEIAGRLGGRPVLDIDDLRRPDPVVPPASAPVDRDLDRHDVERVGPRLLAALDGR